ncbi:hypothetical protein MUG91_G440n3 [Manis pentadactyla]|nr:hypothetical protein MUG91_G440n3 [Manis pentadactyla]
MRWSQTAVRHREKSPLSRSISPACPGKLPAAAEDGGGGGGGIPQWHQDLLCPEPHEVTLPKVLEEREAPSLSTEDSFPPYLGRARVTKIYYRRVQMKRGVAVSWDEVEPASKKSKRDKLAYSEVAEEAEEASQTSALDDGFRCLGCCRVFPSLEVLQDHVDNAVREGFSCQVFPRILAWLNDEEEEEEEENRCTII